MLIINKTATEVDVNPLLSAPGNRLSSVSFGDGCDGWQLAKAEESRSGKLPSSYFLFFLLFNNSCNRLPLLIIVENGARGEET